MTEAKLKWLEALARKANEEDANPDQVLNRADHVLGGYGVEAIRNEDTWGNFWGNVVALYVNRGETYNPTLLYDVVENEFLVTSWGDWVEAKETCNV